MNSHRCLFHYSRTQENLLFTSSKATLKNKIKVEVSLREIVKYAILIEGMLHSSIHWPKECLVEDLVKGIKQ